MINVVDEELLSEVERYSLRHTCEACAFFIPESGACAEGFPNAEHRARPVRPGDHLVFCKRFELG